MTDDGVLENVGPRLRALRTERGSTLGEIAEATGISVSTLSRLESGGRRATLELLLPLAREFLVALDDLVGAPPTTITSYVMPRRWPRHQRSGKLLCHDGKR